MKYVMLLLSIFSFQVFSQIETGDLIRPSDHCYFEGRKWRGEREFAGDCASEREVNTMCLQDFGEDSETKNKLRSCECLMENSEFYRNSRRAFEFKTNRSVEAREYNESHSYVEKKERTKELYKELCYPTKAIELKGNCEDDRCDRYYALYAYTENNSGTNPECSLIRTSYNYPHVGTQKFYFPGATNVSGLFINLIELSGSIVGYAGPFNPDYLNDDDALAGDLNCSGTLSQVVEEEHQRQKALLEEGAIDNMDRSEPVGISPASIDSDTEGNGGVINN